MFHAYCIANPVESIRQNHINLLITDQNIHALDVLKFDTDKIAIMDIRAIQKFIHQKPFASQAKAVVVNADKLTRDAAQALLKTLEEPPAHTQIFLETENPDNLLPTIISRCQVVVLPHTRDRLTAEEIQNLADFWKKSLPKSIGHRMAYTQKLTADRQNYIHWLKTQIVFFRTLLIQSYSATPQNVFGKNQVFRCLNLLITALQNATNNLSLKLVSDHLFINI